MKLSFTLCSLVVLIAVMGCSTRQPDDLGIKTGTITHVYPAGFEPVELAECRVPFTPEQIATGRYVQVQFTSYKLHRSIHVFVPSGRDFNNGDKVVVSDPYCIGSHKPEITGLAPK
ncbi:hypothetical protein [Duganella vulcania]|jgi:hypothetical protein|uniref:Lipoprotein n=1 Tax=Duganella vulcania TaxID=2692166 RepID=A0A845GL02_9BURK|nr:hypothetical protein [Duganella vulcania]MYM94112.1 hypothetical protein [Duganella vulcania]